MRFLTLKRLSEEKGIPVSTLRECIKKGLPHYKSPGGRKIRVSDPATPEVVASFDTPGEPTEVAVSGDLVIVNDAFSLLVLRSK